MTSEAELEGLIEQFNTIDLHREELAFTQWLYKKKSKIDSKAPSLHSSPRSSPIHFRYEPSLASHKSSIASNYKSFAHGLSPEKLSKMDPMEIKDLIARADKNRKAYQDLIVKKDALLTEHLNNVNLKTKKQEQAELEDRKKQLEKKKKKREQLVKWAQKKTQLEELQLQRQEESEMKKKQELETKKIENEKAFKQWKQIKKVQRAATPFQHKAPWVSIEVSSKPANDSECLQSPPHLFKEYDKYAEKSPEFLRKYRLLVASGGMKSSVKRK
jgi:hypothetical protein